MHLAPFKVLLDANVLFPFTLRDTLLRAAARGFFQMYWSEEILDEATRNLVRAGLMTTEKAVRLHQHMTARFPESMVVEYEPLIDAMPNQSKDRHVAAAAVKAGAQVIVTNNLKDFRVLPGGLEAQSPDEFLSNLFDLSPDEMVQVVYEQERALQRPSRTMADVLASLAKVAPEFADSVLSHSTAWTK